MGAVHRIASLESHDALPAEAGKLSSNFSRSQTQIAKIIMMRRFDSLYASADIPRISFIDRVIRSGVRGARAAENRISFSFAVRLPDIFDMQHGKHHTFGVTQGNFAAARFQCL